LDFHVNKIRLELRWGAILPIAAILLITIGRFGTGDGVAATVLLFASLAAHEAGHAVAAALTGTKFFAVGLCLKGAYIRRNCATGATELLISSAGPLVNLIMAMSLWNNHGLFQWLAQMNLFLAVINLLPYRGSDGQRIFAQLRGMKESTALATPGSIASN